MRLPLLLSVAAALVLAGCAAPDALQPQAAPAPAPAPDAAAAGEDAPEISPGVRASIQAFGGTIDASLSPPLPCVGEACLHGQACVDDACVNGARFDFLAEGATALLAELRWEGPMDLDLRLHPEASRLWVDTNGPHLPERQAYVAEGGAPGAPDAVARLLVDDPEALADSAPWTAVVTGKGAAQVPFELRVTLLFGGAPPEGWSAFDAEA